MHHHLNHNTLTSSQQVRQLVTPPIKAARRNRTLALIALGYLAGCGLPARADLAALQQAYVDQGYGMFLHFNMGTYSGQQWSAWNLPPDTFTVVTSAANPTGSIKVATDQWAATAKAAGMTYGVLTTKHHDGFELWDTAAVNSSGLSNHDIAATTWYNNPASPNYHVDVVKAYADSFRAQGLKVGLYYSIWDRNAGVGINGPYDGGDPGPAEMGHPTATTAYVKAQLLELLTNYGAIDVIWTDGWPWQTNYYTNKVDYTEVYSYIKQISPDTLLLDNSVLHTMVGTDIVAWEATRPPSGNILPSEMAGTISADGSWFYTTAGAATLKSAATLASDITFCNANHCTYLLNVPPGKDGMIQANMVQRLAEVLAIPAPAYTLTYDANGGSGAQSDGSSPYVSGTTVTVLGAGTISKPSYTFTGWNTVAIGGGTSYAPGATFSITANTTLYAQWSVNATSTTVINVQYYSTGGADNLYGNASMTGQQGIVASTDTTPFWNQFTAGGYGWIPNPFTDMTNQILYQTDDSSGLVDSGIRLSGSRAQSVVRSDSGIPLFRGGIYAANGDGGTSLTFTLSGLTVGQSYDLYVYSAGPTFYNGNSLITVTGSAVTSTSTVWNSSTTTYTAQNTASFPGILPTSGGSLTIVASNPTQYFGINGFSIVSTIPDGNAYDTWAAGLTDPAFDADPNKDGIDNGMAWILGASGTGNAAGNLLKLPALSHDLSGALVITFDRLIASHPLAPLVAQYGGNLSGWTDFAVPANGGSSSDGNLTVVVAPGAGSTAAYDRITVTIPAIHMAAHPATFFRLKAVK